MAKIRALTYGLSAGTYEVEFKDRQGRKGTTTLSASDGTDLEYAWVDFATSHGFSIDSVEGLKTV